jgi:2'-5' RNA ligase
MQQAIKPIATVLNENYKRQLATNEYLLILNPHEELRNKVQQVKKEFSEAYHDASRWVPAALGGKPHVTLVRFTQLALMEERIVQRLRTISMGYCPFKVELKDFGSFPSHSIFINVTSKLPIRGLVNEIKDIQRLMKLDKDHKPHFIDEPHLPIARKLLPWQYEKGWLEYSNKSFTGKFVADAMLLLKRQEGGSNDGPLSGGRGPWASRAWQIAERFAFQNLPVATRQGQLFA